MSIARFLITSLSILTLSILACRSTTADSPMHTTQFGTLPDGRSVGLHTLRNAHGMEVTIMDFGGVILSLRVPDKQGSVSDVVLGFDSLAPYIYRSPYFGALIGRCGNRIARGHFTLDGTSYTLATNNGKNHLHGGVRGFDKVLWAVDSSRSDEGHSLTLTYHSPDGEEGYPGNLDVSVTYSLNDSNALEIDYTARTDKPTVVNLTQHSYFNLEAPGTPIADHMLMIDADRFTPVDDGLIPTGELRPVQGTPMDFRTPTSIGSRIDTPDEQLNNGGGYDHNWVLAKPLGTFGLAARVFEPVSGRVMEIRTTEPGLQFYSGNFLDGTLVGKGGVRYGHRTGFCLETQHFPDSPNHPSFPSTVLRPGETYSTRTIYSFSIDETTK